MMEGAMKDFLPFTRPSLAEEEIEAVTAVLRSGWIASGPKVLEFEQALSQRFGGRPVRALNHATAALEIALRACRIGAGDEVLVPALSFVASANVVMRVGAHPVFVDVDLDSRNINLEQAEAAITPRTRAIMPVHFAGLPVNMDALYALAVRRNLRVIEDAAHAIGASWHGQPLGSFGDLVCFSFHANKNMTTIEGGAISGGTPEELAIIEQQRFHGLIKLTADSFEVHEAAGKYNLPDVNASIGLKQLGRLDDFNRKRRALVERYFALWEDQPPVRLPARGDAGHCWHLFAPLLPVDAQNVSRAKFIAAMAARRIAVGVHYPAIHLFAAYRALGYGAGQFVNAERIGRETVTLPLFPGMSLSDVDRVVEAVQLSLDEART
jgi:dTDP-4-amino-4,6-dideoxygalactose transaminase